MDKHLQDLKRKGRSLGSGAKAEPALGPLEQLQGNWKSEGMGWNMIALPFAAGPLAPGWIYSFH